MNIKKIIKNRKLILEGIKNSILKNDIVEEIAKERMEKCVKCKHIDLKGDKCEIKGTQPCCDLCGCSLHFKTRSLSSKCPDEKQKKWKAILTEEEENNL